MQILDIINSITGLLTAFGTLLSGIAALWSYKSSKQSSLKPSSGAGKPSPKDKRAQWLLFLGFILISISASIFLVRALNEQEQPLNVQLTTQAWDALNDGNYQGAITFAEKCINEFKGSADREQSQLENSSTPLPPIGKVSDQVKETIISRGLLNDVATCFYIKGQSAENLGRKDEAIQAYQAASKYTYARTWDPKGWFWSPSEVASDRLSLLKSTITSTPTTTETSTVTQTPTVTITPTVSFTPINVSDTFFPSGWMGDWGDIKLDTSSMENPYSEPTSIKITYSADRTQGEGWAGIYWQYPDNNWGNKPEGRNLTGATRLTFWARGQKDGEKAEFKVGGITGRYPESIKIPVSTGVITLSDNWQQYTIDLKGNDLSHVIGGFFWVTGIDMNPVGSTIYLDDIRYE